MPEDQVLVPHLQCSLNTSLLRVIDNDTGVEVPSIFHCIQPHLFSKNKVRSREPLCNASPPRARIEGVLPL